MRRCTPIAAAVLALSLAHPQAQAQEPLVTDPAGDANAIGPLLHTSPLPSEASLDIVAGDIEATGDTLTFSWTMLDLGAERSALANDREWWFSFTNGSTRLVVIVVKDASTPASGWVFRVPATAWDEGLGFLFTATCVVCPGVAAVYDEETDTVAVTLPKAVLGLGEGSVLAGIELAAVRRLTRDDDPSRNIPALVYSAADYASTDSTFTLPPA